MSQTEERQFGRLLTDLDSLRIITTRAANTSECLHLILRNDDIIRSINIVIIPMDSGGNETQEVR